MIKFPHTLGTSSASNTIGNGTAHLYLAGLSENNSSEASCSGALIAPTWLLTLAECAPMAKWATIGSKCASGEDDSELIEVVRQVLDPDYTVSVTPYHELAMLELKTPSKYTPVNISWDSYLDTSTLWVRGFDTSTMNKTLVETTAKLWGFDECDKFYSGHPGYERTLHGSMQCLREIQCQQDRGSAVMVDVNGTSQLIGLTYWQSQNNSIAPAVYILVAAGEAFIQSVLQSPTTPTPTYNDSSYLSTYPPSDTNVPSTTSPSSTETTQTTTSTSTPQLRSTSTSPKTTLPSSLSTYPPTSTTKRPTTASPTTVSSTTRPISTPQPTGKSKSPKTTPPLNLSTNAPAASATIPFTTSRSPRASTTVPSASGRTSTPQPTGPSNSPTTTYRSTYPPAVSSTKPLASSPSPFGSTSVPSITRPTSTIANQPTSVISTPKPYVTTITTSSPTDFTVRPSVTSPTTTVANNPAPAGSTSWPSQPANPSTYRPAGSTKSPVAPGSY